MKIIVNGSERDIEAATLAAALQALEYEDAVVATALNGNFVPARKREQTRRRREEAGHPKNSEG